MKAVFLVGLALGSLAGLTQSAVALACGASAPPYYVDDQHAPSATAAPLNAPIVVHLREDADGPVVDSFNPELTLTKTGSDVAMELKALGGLLTLAWVPTQSLEPETTYEAHFNPGYEGIPDTIWPFTTGTESTPALSLEGQLQVMFESGIDTIYECPSSPKCGTNDMTGCSSRLVNVTKARVKIPRAVDGFAQRSGTLSLTDDQPYEFVAASKTGPAPYHGRNVSSMLGADLDDRSVSDLLITVPDEEIAYRPCFAFTAWDARGDQATAQPLCLDAPSPAVVGNNDDPGLANDIKKSGPSTSTSCSLGHGPSSQGCWLALLGPLALLRGVSRRRAH